jgi:hypothetical protein
VIRLNLWSTRALFVRTTAGAIGIRLSLRPLFLGRVKLMQTSGASRRENADAYLRHCEEQGDEAIHSFFVRQNGLLR